MSLKSTTKILNLPALLRLRKLWARRQQHVVFTNGVFDILHAGHVELLEKARALGDVLVVGVNSDASVRRLGKGSGRPINSLKDRQRVLAALACVDVVVAFSEDTPESLISKLQPETLVKGADYRPEQVAGLRHAGRLVLLPLKKGYSTTRLIRQIRRSKK
jgi:D-beta-D-heptose 7-phosphate kinase/D-beta-D-heptose 1-phosphate adenosyltransferase